MTDYFQDIVPPDEGERQGQGSERSIRDITLPSRGKTGAEPRSEMPRIRRRAGGSGAWLWVLAIGALLVIGGLGLFVFRKTTVTVTPRMHDVTLDGLPAFTAYPAATAATGTLVYGVQEFDLEESEPVKAAGVQHVERKASGSVTVFNAHSAAPVKLLANTRFESAGGMIFRTPAAVVIPGKKGSMPGSVSVTIVADKAGTEYNVAPGRFSLPGLKGGKMFTVVYATSEAAFNGGFSGDEPATDSATLAAAVSAMRGRIEQKARDTLSAATGTVAFTGLARISYTDLPSTQEEGAVVRLHSRAHVTAPTFGAPALTAMIASQVSADATGAEVRLVPQEGYGASSADASPAALGTDPISFMLAGKARLIWQVDVFALARTLAGRDGSAFQTIINKEFPGIKEAKARIEPFWSNTFPKDPASIRIVVSEPASR